MRRHRDSRQAILDAATVEFAAHGFAGVSVDRIARRARVNKAMIYYHFDSKIALYRTIIRGTFDALFARVQEIARSPRPPDEKIAAFIEAVVREGEARPEFPRTMAREIADGARRLDPETVRAMARLPRTVAAFVEDGIARGQFIEVDPFLAYFIVFGPLMFYLMSAPLRVVIGRLELVDPDRLRTAAFVDLLQTTTRRAFRRQPAPATGRRARRSARRRVAPEKP
jgi:AcrR family transcriptional regulator